MLFIPTIIVCYQCNQAKLISEFLIIKSGRKKGKIRRPCKDCNKINCKKNYIKNKTQWKDYYYSNHDKNKEAKRRYNAKNKSRQKLLNHEYYLKNSESIKQRAYEWRRNNPDKVRDFSRLRSMRERSANGYCDSRRLKDRWQYFGGKCYLCGLQAKEIDHVIPLSRGGSNWPSNLRPICLKCNRTKYNKRLSEL